MKEQIPTGGGEPMSVDWTPEHITQQVCMDSVVLMLKDAIAKKAISYNTNHDPADGESIVYSRANGLKSVVYGAVWDELEPDNYKSLRALDTETLRMAMVDILLKSMYNCQVGVEDVVWTDDPSGHTGTLRAYLFIAENAPYDGSGCNINPHP